MPNYIIGNSDLMNVWGNSSAHSDAPDNTKIDTGWVELEKPNPYFMNYIHNQQEQKINHILKHGVALWNATTSYDLGDSVTYNGEIYKSLTTNLNSVPSRASTDWAPVTPFYESTDNSLAIAFDLPTNTVDYTIPAANLVNKFSNTDFIKWSTTGSTVVATYSNPSNPLLLAAKTFTAADNGKVFQLNSAGGGFDLTLPLWSSIPNGWNIKLEVIATSNSKLRLVTQGTDRGIRNGLLLTPTTYDLNGFVNSHVTISKVDGETGHFNYSSGSERIGGFVTGVDTQLIGTTDISNLVSARPIKINSNTGNIVDVGSITASGFYSFSGISPIGIPLEATSSYGWLTVLNYNETGSLSVYQQWIDRNVNKKWYRIANPTTGAWSVWFPELTQVTAGSGVAVSLNSFTSSGDYTLIGLGATDSPQVGVSYGILTVKRFSAEDLVYGDVIHQEWRPINGDILWTRYRSQAQVWSTWIKRW